MSAHQEASEKRDRNNLHFLHHRMATRLLQERDRPQPAARSSSRRPPTAVHLEIRPCEELPGRSCRCKQGLSNPVPRRESTPSGRLWYIRWCHEEWEE